MGIDCRNVLFWVGDAIIMVVRDISRKTVIEELSIYRDRDNKYKATSSKSISIDMLGHCSRGLVGIITDLKVKMRGPRVGCFKR